MRKLDTPLDKLTRRAAGRRSTSKTDRKRGRYIQARPSPGNPKDLAFDATLRAAAPFQNQRKAEELHGPAFRVKRHDYQKKVRVRKSANLILFVVDASWSMAVAERMAATKGAIMSLLTDAYQRRDRVGLIVFQKDQARLVLPPTNSVELAQKALRDIPVGGKTPLSAGLTLTHMVIQQEMRLHPDVAPLAIILTDGAGNVSQSGLARARRVLQNLRGNLQTQNSPRRDQHGASRFRSRAGAKTGRRAGIAVLFAEGTQGRVAVSHCARRAG